MRFPYTLIELEEMIDASPQVRLLVAKQEEARRKESIWHDISLSAGFNPLRTADRFTDRIRAGFAVSMPLDILLFRDTTRVSRQVADLELEKLRGDLKREVRRLWYERQRRLVELQQLQAELGLARLQVQKASTLLVAQDASLDDVREAEVTVSRIEATMMGKRIDLADLEDQLLTLVGKR
jgi:outer membrane protein TolC